MQLEGSRPSDATEMAVQASRSGRNLIERLREEGEIHALDQVIHCIAQVVSLRHV